MSTAKEMKMGLESTLRVALQNALDEYHQATGFTVRRVDLDLYHVQIVGRSDQRALVSKVTFVLE